MAERRYDDAAREYGAAYEVSKDPVLFFKIGSALDKADKCAVAITYYRRYLREAKPSANFQKLTTERIATCEGRLRPGSKADEGAAAGSEGASSPGNDVLDLPDEAPVVDRPPAANPVPPKKAAGDATGVSVGVGIPSVRGL